MLGWPSGGHWPAMCVTIVPTPSVDPPSASLTVKAVAMGNVVAGNDQTWCSSRVVVPAAEMVVKVTSTFIENAPTALSPEQKPRLDVWPTPEKFANCTPEPGLLQLDAP